MGPVIESFLSGFPIFMLHAAVTIAILAAGLWVYTAITPYREFELIRRGNLAAAISFSAAALGIAIPLAFCMAASVSVYDVLLWGVVTVILQLIAYKATDLLLRELPKRIEAGEAGPALVLAAIKLAVAAINAAAVSG